MITTMHEEEKVTKDHIPGGAVEAGYLGLHSERLQKAFRNILI